MTQCFLDWQPKGQYMQVITDNWRRYTVAEIQIILNGNHFHLKWIKKTRVEPKDMSSHTFRNVFQTLFPFQILLPFQIFKLFYFIGFLSLKWTNSLKLLLNITILASLLFFFFFLVIGKQNLDPVYVGAELFITCHLKLP